MSLNEQKEKLSEKLSEKKAEQKEKLSVKLDEKKVKHEEKKAQAKIKREERKLYLKEAHTDKKIASHIEKAINLYLYLITHYLKSKYFFIKKGSKLLPIEFAVKEVMLLF